MSRLAVLYSNLRGAIAWDGRAPRRIMQQFAASRSGCVGLLAVLLALGPSPVGGESSSDWLADVTSSDRKARTRALHRLADAPRPERVSALAEALSLELEKPEEQEELWFLAARAARGFAGAEIKLPDEVVSQLEFLRDREPKLTVIDRTSSRAARRVPKYPFALEAEHALRNVVVERSGKRLDAAVEGQPLAKKAQLVAEQAWMADSFAERSAARTRLEALGAAGVDASMPYTQTAGTRVKQEMAEYFGRMYQQAPAKVSQGLLRLVDDPSPRTWGHALFELKQATPSGAAAALIERIERDGVTDSRFDRAAIRTLGGLEDPAAIAFLRNQLQHTSREVGVASARALRELGPAGLQVLIEATASSDRRLREIAVRPLSRSDAPQAAEAVEEYLSRHPEDPTAERMLEEHQP